MPRALLWNGEILIPVRAPTNGKQPPERTSRPVTIRNLDDDIKLRLRVRAAEHGRSMEEEAREILRRAMDEAAPPRNMAAAIRARVAPLGGVDLDLPPREPMPAPPRSIS